MEENKYITLEEAAVILGTNKRQIVRMIKAGKIKAMDINAANGQRNIWRVLKSELLPPDNNVSGLEGGEQ